ncbi:MAG: hypothetical protein RLZZ332_483 [Actinomycetota bacterium]
MPTRTVCRESDASLVGVISVRESQRQVVWEGVAQHFSPLNHQHVARCSRTVEIEVVELCRALKAIDVGMTHIECATSIFMHQREGGRSHGIDHTEGCTQRLGEHRLAGTEVA